MTPENGAGLTPENDSLQIIAGLGNPGPEYANHRHNAGFWFVDTLAACLGLDFHFESRWSSELCSWDTALAPRCRLLKPRRYMNENGLSVAAAADYYKVAPERILIAHDELDLPVGVLRIKEGGGHGGHRGLRSVCRHLGSAGFKRLRIGVDHPGSREQVNPWLLSAPPGAVRREVQRALDDCLQYREALLLGQLARIMNVLHQAAPGS